MHNQTVIDGGNRPDDECRLDSELKIVEFLKKSQQFKHLENIQKLAEGGESIVYKINYAGFEEVVLKVPKDKLQQVGGYEDLVHETQLIKSIYNENYTVEVKEEIIEVDQKSRRLLRYCVIEERARYSLYDLYAFKATS